jgi:TRAP-type uncharacterized transport system substrate-binding protein
MTIRRIAAHTWVLLVLGILAGGLAPDGAIAEQATKFHELASGEAERTYHDVYAPRLMKLLPGFRIRNRATKGSGENLDLLADRQADLGFAQLDVYELRVRTQPERYTGLTLIGRLDQECVYLAYRRAGPVTTFAGLTSDVDGRKAKVAVGPAGGGMAGTWANMAHLVPGLAAAKVSNTGGALALNQLSLGMFDAVGWVTAPRNLDHLMLRAVRSNADLGLLAVAAEELQMKNAAGDPAYLRDDVAISTGRGRETVRTVCTSAMVFARPGANARLVEFTSQVLSLERDKILGLKPMK